MANITLLPSAKVPLVYSDTNTMSTEWYRFFWNVYGFTGDSSGAIPVNKGGTGFTSYADHDLLIGNSSGTLSKTQLTGVGISITYSPGFISLGLGTSGVTPGTYGSASQVGVFTVNQYGSITAASNTSIAISATQITSGTLATVRGGTGLSAFVANQLLYAGSTSTINQSNKLLFDGSILTSTGGIGGGNF